MKTFEEFMVDASWCSYNIQLEESKKRKKEELKQRMSNAHQKKVRAAKLRKLQSMDSHWVGLS
jgi:hypothetical protein